jgi:hypothetical protein
MNPGSCVPGGPLCDACADYFLRRYEESLEFSEKRAEAAIEAIVVLAKRWYRPGVARKALAELQELDTDEQKQIEGDKGPPQ